MGKIPHEDKMRIQAFQEIGFGYFTIVANFPESGWNLSSAKAVCLLFVVH